MGQRTHRTTCWVGRPNSRRPTNRRLTNRCHTSSSISYSSQQRPGCSRQQSSHGCRPQTMTLLPAFSEVDKVFEHTSELQRCGVRVSVFHLD